MSFSNPYDMPEKRYKIENVEFSDDMATVFIWFVDPTKQGPVVQERSQWRVLCDGELRTQLFDIYESVCDLIDAAFAENRMQR